MTHVYDWAGCRGYRLPYGDDARPTHLLLDGGKWRVPDDAHGAMLNAYAASLVRRPDKRPCVVEVRTPVFKMFVDLDTRFASRAQAEAAAAGEGAVVRLLETVCGAVAPGEPAVVCAADRPKADGDGHKLGFHIVWPGVLVASHTALALRGRLVEALAALPDLAPALGLVNDWPAAVDASVYTSSGLRLPWSAKGRGDDRFYELAFRVDAGGGVAPARATSVSEIREALRDLSIRTFAAEPTLALGEPPRAESDRHDWVPKSLGAYGDVLPLLAAALPIQFAGQKFTAVMAAEHCFMLRSTARYCFNLGRAHRTNNVYFVLTRRGVCQRCYCRCETDEGRKYGMCKDFSSDCWEVPREVLDAFFPAAADRGDEPDGKRHKAGGGGAGGGAAGGAGGGAAAVGAMPSRAGRSFLALDNLVARSRPALSPSGAGKRRGRT